jgi:hypothetical protein
MENSLSNRLKTEKAVVKIPKMLQVEPNATLKELG